MPIAAGTRAAGGISHPAIWRATELARTPQPGVPTGFAGLDAEFPGGGWPVGSLTEVIHAQEGIGELRLLSPALSRVSSRHRPLAWIAPPYRPYAPALIAAGIDPVHLFVIVTGDHRKSLWALEQTLRSNACGAVLAWIDTLGYTELRRLQLAAEGNSGPVLLFRSVRAAEQPSPASLRIALAATRDGLSVRILKRRGVPLDRPVLLASAQGF